jgi:dihydrofolate synthase/folylpolyglutamate synthase
MTARERLFALEQHGIKLGLENITTIVNALGRPDRAFTSVHVAGTNGKGSVTAMVERGLRSAGYRTGRYTSPHLSAIEERMAIDGVPVDARQFDAVTEQVLEQVDTLLASKALTRPPTFFEVTTAIAFEVFKRADVSAAVIEVGLGGRFDATNVIAPVVTAITSIGFDHERHLGSTLDQIAREKAGIIKPHVPVIVGAMAPTARAVIAETARDQGAPQLDAQPGTTGTPVTLALNGAHQHYNAAVAVEVLKQWSLLAQPAERPPVARADLLAALTDVEWPARLEWLRMPAGGDVLIDAAHNPAGAEALADYVLTAGTGRLPMLVSVMRDKDVSGMLAALLPAVSRFIAVTANTPRALPAHDLAAFIRQHHPGTPCTWYDEPEDAVRAVCSAEPRVVAAGSIFLVGPLRAHLLMQGALPVRYPSKASPFYLS